ncbi:uracil-DNA glycosylase [Spirochaetia bacterium]|nr:uracil-DNA glycosylase [Spirochaetia bacterium]
MTSEEKQKIAFFLDTAEDVLRDGHRKDRPDYLFIDDSPTPDHASHIEKTPESSGEKKDISMAPEFLAESPRLDGLELLAAEIHKCAACQLCSTRTKAVPGEGVTNPLVIVIGEAPGADEDRTGQPFVGRAGQLLDKMLAAIDLSRETNCFIANMLKCRPPENRDPRPAEISACVPFLDRQIDLLRPRAILCVGRVAMHGLLHTTEVIGKAHGQWTLYRNIPFFPIYHPSAILRDDSLRRPTWEDLKLFRAKVNEIV